MSRRDPKAAVFLHAGTETLVPSARWLDTLLEAGFAGVIFDCDGTLVDSASAHLRAMQQAAARQGTHMDRHWYEERGGLDRVSLFQAHRAANSEAFDVACAVSDSLQSYPSHLAHVHPIGATIRLLDALGSQGVPVAIATNAERDIARHSLRAAGLDGKVETLTSISDGVRPKPAPDLFLLAAQRLGRRPGDLCVVEDSPQGVQAAQAAGMAVLQLTAAKAG